MTLRLISISLLALSAFAQDKPKEPATPTVSAETQASFERARADEHESAALHEADATRLNATFAAAQKECGTGFEVQRPQRGGPLVCVEKPKAPIK